MGPDEAYLVCTVCTDEAYLVCTVGTDEAYLVWVRTRLT